MKQSLRKMLTELVAACMATAMFIPNLVGCSNSTTEVQTTISTLETVSETSEIQENYVAGSSDEIASVEQESSNSTYKQEDTRSEQFTMLFKEWYDNKSIPFEYLEGIEPVGRTILHDLFQVYREIDDDTDLEFINNGNNRVFVYKNAIGIHGDLRLEKTGYRIYEESPERTIELKNALKDYEKLTENDRYIQPTTIEEFQLLDNTPPTLDDGTGICVNNMVSGFSSEGSLVDLVKIYDEFPYYYHIFISEDHEYMLSLVSTCSGYRGINIIPDENFETYEIRVGDIENTILHYTKDDIFLSIKEDAYNSSHEHLSFIDKMLVSPKFIQEVLGWKVETHDSFINIITDIKDIPTKEHIIDTLTIAAWSPNPNSINMPDSFYATEYESQLDPFYETVRKKLCKKNKNETPW